MDIAQVMEIDSIQRARDDYESQKHNGHVQLSLTRYEELLRHEKIAQFLVEKLYEFEKYGSFLGKSEVSPWLTLCNRVAEGKV